MTDATPLSIETADGLRLGARYWTSENPQATVVVAPALGVPLRYYGDFCSYLALQGLAALCFDYRGIGESAAHRKARFQDWGTQDLDAAISKAQELLPARPLLHVGHSCGAQLLALANGASALSASAFVAVSSPHWRHWRGADQVKMRLMFGLLVPLMALGRTTFPARRLGFSSEDVPAGVMRQWAQWAGYPDYLFDPQHGPGASPQRLRCPLLSMQFVDDEYATRSATQAILRHFSAAAIEERIIDPAAQGLRRLGHLGFFKASKAQSLWPDLSDWLLQQAQRAAA